VWVNAWWPGLVGRWVGGNWEVRAVQGRLSTEVQVEPSRVVSCLVL
jgi:hypothetical protein